MNKLTIKIATSDSEKLDALIAPDVVGIFYLHNRD